MDGEASWNNDVQMECVVERRCHGECNEKLMFVTMKGEGK